MHTRNHFLSLAINPFVKIKPSFFPSNLLNFSKYAIKYYLVELHCPQTLVRTTPGSSASDTDLD